MLLRRRGGLSSAGVGSSGTAGPRAARFALLKQSARRAFFYRRSMSRGRDFCTTAGSRHFCSVGNFVLSHRSARFELDRNLARLKAGDGECTRTKQKRPLPIDYAPGRPHLRRGRDSSAKKGTLDAPVNKPKPALELLLISRTDKANNDKRLFSTCLQCGLLQAQLLAAADAPPLRTQ